MAKERSEAFFIKIPTGGRPKLLLNDTGIDTITSLAAIMCTDEEIASVLGVSVDTLTREENAATFAEAKKNGIADGKSSIRKYQFALAKKNPTMAIWLGKQYLGQKENDGTKDDVSVPQITFICKDTSGKEIWKS